MLVVKSLGLPSCPTSELLRIKRCTTIWSPPLDYGRRHQMKQRGEDRGCSGGGRRCEAARDCPKQARERRDGDPHLGEHHADAIFSQARGVRLLGQSAYTTTVAVIRFSSTTVVGSSPSPRARQIRLLQGRVTRFEGRMGLDCGDR